jgi:hypothetical protein
VRKLGVGRVRAGQGARCKRKRWEKSLGREGPDVFCFVLLLEVPGHDVDEYQRAALLLREEVLLVRSRQRLREADALDWRLARIREGDVQLVDLRPPSP